MADWKAPPADSSKVWLNKSLEVQLLLACNWSCQACDQFSQFSRWSWIKRGTMTLEQIDHFCQEMVEANAYFGRIRLVGGEPTLHPKFADIVAMLHSRLVVTGHIGLLEVITNGTGAAKLEPVKHLIHKVRTSGESAKQAAHTANLVATPASLGYKGKRCGQPEHCGWSLSYYGFAPCSSAAGIMRLRDLMQPHQLVTLPTQRGTENNWPELQKLCDQCYHALHDDDKIKCGTGQREEDRGKNAPGPDVVPLIEAWNTGKQPSWPVYAQVQN
jgi:hypothetical protein